MLPVKIIKNTNPALQVKHFKPIKASMRIKRKESFYLIFFLTICHSFLWIDESVSEASLHVSR